MRDLEKYRGVIPAFYACYDENGEISGERTEALALHFLKKGVKGLYVNGSSGECIYQSVEDRKKVLEHVMKAVGGKLTIIAHVACNNTKDSVELAAHAEKLGVDAIAAIPPIYFHLPDHAIAEYWNDISAAAPHTDFVIYNIPQLAGVALSPSLFRKMRENPNVIGVKNSSSFNSLVRNPIFFRTPFGSVTILLPSIRASPLSGLISVANMRSVVVFPAPFGPNNPKTSPL